MTEITNYPDSRHYLVAVRSKKRPTSNLCTWYFESKKRFCGNYCQRNDADGSRRCWRHKVTRKKHRQIFLVMVTANGAIYNKSIWLKFIVKCQEKEIPLRLIIYTDFMYKTTVRHPWNFISRFRPSPLKYQGRDDIPLHNSHGGLNYTTVVMDMMNYVCSSSSNAQSCILITERTIPIRSPAAIYKQAHSFNDKCVLNPAYNIRFSDDTIPSLPKLRGTREFGLVNYRAQGLFSCKFLLQALPTLRDYCHRFGIAWSKRERVYQVSDHSLYNKWVEYVSAFPDEFLLLNSYLIFLYETRHVRRPISVLKKYMATLAQKDNTVLADIAEYRNEVKRSVIFKSVCDNIIITPADSAVANYYAKFKTGNSLVTNLKSILRYLRKYKKKALFFRSVELDTPANM